MRSPFLLFVSVCVRACARAPACPIYQLLNQLTDFYEILFGYAVERYLVPYFLFLVMSNRKMAGARMFESVATLTPLPLRS